MLTKFINRNIKYIVTNKNQSQKLKYLISLPYDQLIDQLIFSKKKNQTNAIPNQWILQLSAFHDCKKLYQLYQHEKKKNNNKILNITDLNKKWQTINQFGLQQLLQFNNETTIDNNSSIKNIVFDYFTIVQQAIKNPNLEKIVQLTFAGLPYYYPTSLLSYEQLQKLKQHYVLNLDYIFTNIYQINELSLQPSEFYVHKLLPMQLFNISDQSLVRDLHYKYLCCNLSYKSRPQIGYSVAWLSRFGLPCHSYLFHSLKYLKNHIDSLDKRSTQQQVVESIYICNILYVMLRKIIGYNYDQTIQLLSLDQQQIAIIQKIFELVTNLPLTKIIIGNQTNQDKNVIKQTYDIFKNSIIVNESLTSSKTKELLESYKIKQLPKSNNDMSNDSITVFVEVFISRYVLSLFYCFRTNKNHQRLLNQLFTQPLIISCMQNVLLIGDMLAQIVYVEQLNKQFHSKNLFDNESLQCKIKTMVKQFNKFINQLKKNNTQEVYKINNVMRRIYNVQYLLTGQSQLTFDQMSALNLKKTISLQQQMMISLINDNEFIGVNVGESVQQLLKRKIGQRPSIHVNNMVENKYPYLPTLNVKYMNKKEKFIFVRTSFCKQTRINFKEPHVIINLANSSEIQKTMTHFLKSFST